MQRQSRQYRSLSMLTLCVVEEINQTNQRKPMTLTLELNPKQLVDIAKYLAGHTATLGSSVSNDLPVEDSLPTRLSKDITVPITGPVTN